MKVLITGGAGFIGSHLADLLLTQDAEIWAMDNLSTGAIGNIEHLKNNPKYHYQIESIMNVPAIAELVDRVDVIIHLAAAEGRAFRWKGIWPGRCAPIRRRGAACGRTQKSR